MKKALVIGYGISGKAAEKLLQNSGYQVVIYDDKLSDEVANLEGIELAILSPGIAQTHPVCKLLLAKKIRLLGEVQFALQNAQNRSIAITGTNGKTTVTEMTAHLLKDKKAKALGNIGEPLSSYFLKPDPEEILVIELSSYQLETLDGPLFDSAVVLNITPDHLERYKTMENYAKAKLRLQKCMKKGAPFYLHPAILEQYSAFINGPVAALPLEKEILLREIFPFKHDRENALSAYALCIPFGLSFDAFIEKIKSYPKQPHRIEFVRDLDGVLFYNDSKGTNIDAVVKAVEAMKGEVILIAGGVDKGGGYEVWKKTLSTKVAHLITLGESAALIEEAMKDCCNFTRVKTLQEAVLLAKSLAKPGQSVLLSPGCASFDMFKDYKERGELFKQYVEKL